MLCWSVFHLALHRYWMRKESFFKRDPFNDPVSALQQSPLSSSSFQLSPHFAQVSLRLPRRRSHNKFELIIIIIIITAAVNRKECDVWINSFWSVLGASGVWCSAWDQLKLIHSLLSLFLFLLLFHRIALLFIFPRRVFRESRLRWKKEFFAPLSPTTTRCVRLERKAKGWMDGRKEGTSSQKEWKMKLDQ